MGCGHLITWFDMCQPQWLRGRALLLRTVHRRPLQAAAGVCIVYMSGRLAFVVR